MIYVGIDIAKTNHYASIVNYSTGEVLESPFWGGGGGGGGSWWGGELMGLLG